MDIRDESDDDVPGLLRNKQKPIKEVASWDGIWESLKIQRCNCKVCCVVGI